MPRVAHLLALLKRQTLRYRCVYVVGLDFFLRSQPVPSLAMPTLLNFSSSLRSPRSHESGMHHAACAPPIFGISLLFFPVEFLEGEKSSRSLSAG